MDLTGVLPVLLRDPAFAGAVERARSAVARGTVDVVGSAGVRPALVAALTGAVAPPATEGGA
ncbi:hypothetical protein ICW40_18100, partial [Actinotalea ferrariae]|uniref:hypothetical protein n=1 Tax=Actinotalea ferrariae TaxID=1386098 RepID=UPI001C8B6EF5